MEQEKPIKADVLVIGGAVSGCTAARKACEGGADVLLIEKGNVRSAGQTGLCGGMDHLSYAYPPENEPLKDPTLRSRMLSKDEAAERITRILSGGNNMFTRHWPILFDEVYEELLAWEKLGIKVREDDGTIWLLYQEGTGDCQVFFRGAFKGSEIQAKLKQGLEEQGVRILNRTMAVDLLTDNGGVAGAVAINARTGKIQVIKAKAIVIAAGGVGRHHLTHEAYPMVSFSSPLADGSSVGLAYRAGAEVANMEFLSLTPQSRSNRIFFNSGGLFFLWPFERGEPHPILINSKGEEIMPRGKYFQNGKLRLPEHPESLRVTPTQIMEFEEKLGNAPFYWDCRHLPEQAIRDIERGVANEGPKALEYAKERDFDLRKDLLEVRVHPNFIAGGVLTDENARTTRVRGLYASGDANVRGGCIGSALAFGKRAGINATKYALEVGEPVIDERQVKKIEEVILAPLKVKEGHAPLYVERAVRLLLSTYSRARKSEGELKLALEKLQYIKEKFLPKVSAKNPHELTRALELRNIVLTSEMHLRAALERKETRVGGWVAHHLRSDYVEPDPNWNKTIVFWEKGGEMELIIREEPLGA